MMQNAISAATRAAAYRARVVPLRWNVESGRGRSAGVTVEALESLLSRARRTLKNALRPLLETQETQPCTTNR
jgi:hypothetical protein